MKTEELKEVLDQHKSWIDDKEGQRADLSEANLRGADLSEANLRRADLSGADLRRADLRGADLSEADLSRADLSEANLSRADLRGANIDFASWPLWCGSLGGVILCDKLKAQLMYHMIVACGADMFTEEQIKLANTFHRVSSKDIPKIER